MKLKSRALLAGLVAAAVTLSGCAAGGSPGEGSDSGALSGTLSFASWQWLEPARGEAVSQAVQAFLDENPGVELEKVEITRADYEKTISTQIGAGGGPDVFIISDAFFPTLMAAGALEPLDGVVPVSAEGSLRESNAAYVRDGSPYAYLWEQVPYTLFWNKKLVEDQGITPPSSVEELVTAVQQVKEKTGKTGFTVRHQLNEEAPWWTDFQNWPFGFGGGWSSGGKLTIDTPQNIAAIEAFKSVYDSGAFGIGDDASTYRSKFAAGEVGFTIDNSAVVMTLINDNPNLTAQDVGASVLPFPDGTGFAPGVSIAVNANSKNKELATAFLTWVLEEPAQAAFAEALFPSGVATGVPAPQQMLDANPWVAGFYEQLADSRGAFIEGFEEYTAQISHIVLTQVQRVLIGEVSAAEALKLAQAEAEKVVN